MNTLPVPNVNRLTKPYWDSCLRGQLAIQRCAHCQKAFLYPRIWCPYCWAPDPVWEDADGKGEVIACTVVHQAPYEAYAPRLPYVVAIVRLAEGPQLMANIVNCDVGSVHIGMKVAVMFENRSGVSIPQFTPQTG